MKTIGLIGGMSWESTAEYYRIINEAVRDRLGGHHSAQCVLYSVDFEQIREFHRTGDWQGAAGALGSAAEKLQSAGADFILICTNTMHKVADEVQRRVSVPLIHIAESTAQAVHAAGMQTIGLLGTRYTMEDDFYRGRLEREHRLQVLIPEESERGAVHDVIFDELCLGAVRPESRGRFCQIIGALAARGAEGVILGCTEISILVKPGDTPVRLFDTTEIHARHAVSLALE